MPATYSEMAVLAFFYIVFSSQIFLMSIYYPGKLCRRVEYVLENFPPAQYPKLYPASATGAVAEKGRRGLRIYRAINYAIALIGVAILLAMALSGYRPDLKGGDEIFVLMYFFLQATPLFYAEVKELRQYRLMRQEFSSSARKANLKPRRLFDFVSPAYVATAVLLYLLWLAYYLADKGFSTPWEGEVYFTVVGVTGMNLFFAGMIAKFLYGKKPNPCQAYKDQLKQIEGTAKVMVFSSIGISVFLIVTIAVDRYGLEVFDPPLTSLYMQACAAFGIGFLFRTLKIEATDFEVYKDDAALPSTCG